MSRELDLWAADQTCHYCAATEGLRIEWRLVTRPIGSFSLSGKQMKMSAYHWPWAICDNCGHESKGRVDTV